MSQAIYPDLAGKAVVVTGGATGIGAAIVRAFAAQGAKVGFIDIAEAPAQALASELASRQAQVRFIAADLRDISALQRAITTLATAHGATDILINNAGHDERHSTESVTPAFFDERIAVNLKHAFFAAQAVLPGMKANGGGSILNFSSVSWMTAAGGMPVYTAAKSAMLGLTRSLARDYGPFGIRVNAIAPGWVKTERQVTKWLTPETDKRREDAQCLKMWVMPEHVANMALFLSSTAAAACTAQHFVVDAGRA